MTNTNNFKNVSTQVALELLKKQTAFEMGIELGSEQTSRNNGRVGAEMTKKLVKLGEIALAEMVNTQGEGNVELTSYLNGKPDNQTELH